MRPSSTQTRKRRQESVRAAEPSARCSTSPLSQQHVRGSHRPTRCSLGSHCSVHSPPQASPLCSLDQAAQLAHSTHLTASMTPDWWTFVRDWIDQLAFRTAHFSSATSKSGSQTATHDFSYVCTSECSSCDCEMHRNSCSSLSSTTTDSPMASSRSRASSSPRPRLFSPQPPLSPTLATHTLAQIID